MNRKKYIDIESNRKLNRNKIAELNTFLKGYDIDKFMQDLKDFYDNEVDFNFDKISDMLNKPGKLDTLINRAKKNNSHPVIEFVQDIFKELPDRL